MFNWCQDPRIVTGVTGRETRRRLDLARTREMGMRFRVTRDLVQEGTIGSVKNKSSR